MLRIKVWFAVAAFALAVMLLLGRLAVLEPRLQSLRQDVAAAAPPQPVSLSDDNLTDAIASLRLRHRIVRVGWDHRMLAIDLAIAADDRQPSALWRDLVALVQFSFGETDNVRQTLMRVYQTAGEGDSILLFYGDPRRGDWPRQRLTALVQPQDRSGESFRRRVGLSATPAGERWLAKV